MIVYVRGNAGENGIASLGDYINGLGGSFHRAYLFEKTFFVVSGIDMEQTCEHPAIEKIFRPGTPYQLAHRELNPEGTAVAVGGAVIGDGCVSVIAGPCSVENKQQLSEIAGFVKSAGAEVLRGGAYKLRTSPYTFQGLGEEGLKILKEVSEENNIPVVTEFTDTRDADLLFQYADIIQIGTRNSLNFPLLQLAGEMGKPVLLKRGQSSTVEEFLMASEHILSRGNSQVILCERGIRTFEDATRNTLDISAIPILKRATHLPVIADPSHAAGDSYLVPALALAAIAAGADGIMVEVHSAPQAALSDSGQALSFSQFSDMMENINKITGAFGKAAHAPLRGAER